jgi:hypothetical protein
MDSQQHELFDDFPRTADPRGNFAEFRVGRKIIQVPKTFWKDGRIRADLSEFGAGEVVSRNEANLQERVIQVLRQSFGTIVEAVREEFARACTPARSIKPRLRKKDLAETLARQPATDLVYANPFAEKTARFGRYPDWLLEREDLEDQEKLILGRLLFPLPPICKSWDPHSGAIIGLNQGKLGSSLGRSRQWANEWIIELQGKRWIECTGPQGAKHVTRFLWKEGMPETCRTAQHVSAAKPATQRSAACHTAQQRPATQRGGTCHTAQHVSQGVEKRESKREEREGSRSLGWGS